MHSRQGTLCEMQHAQSGLSDVGRPLFERIQANLGPHARAADIEALLIDVEAAIASAEQDRSAQHAIAIAASSDDATADAASDAEARSARQLVRLRAQVEQLTARRAEIAASDRRREEAAHKQEAIQRRDALVADLAERWPVIEAEIVALLQRITDSDDEMKAYEPSSSAEYLARGLSGWRHNGSPVERLTAIRLPSFADHPWTAWPQRNPNMLTLLPVHRRIGS